MSLNDALVDLVAKKLVAPDEAYEGGRQGGFEPQIKRLGIDVKAMAGRA